MSRYDDILARLRTATGPDKASGHAAVGERTLDADIFQLLGGDVWQRAYMRAQEPCGCPHDMAIEIARERWAPRYTASIDLALDLVAEQFPAWDWDLSNNPPNFYLGEPHGEDEDFAWSVGDGKTAPLAILISLFEALKQKEDSNG